MNKENKKILAFIPARGGSKGLPGKNVINLGGVPLIAHSIRAGLEAKQITRTLVSTDDANIARVAKRYGAYVPFLRPVELATDTSLTIDAVLDTLDRLQVLGERYDAVALLEPTSPLRRRNDVDGAIDILMANWNKTDAVVSLGEIHLESPFIVKRIDRGYVKPLMNFVHATTRRQDLPRAYFPYGVIYLCKTATLRREKTFYPKRIMPHIIERWQNYEIDDIWDLTCIRAIAKKQKLNQR